MSVQDDFRPLMEDNFDEDEESLYGTPKHAKNETIVTKPLENTAKWRQTMAALGFSFGGLVMGNALGWSATSLPQLESATSPLQLSKNQSSWVGSLVCLGALAQGPLTSLLMVRLGRRSTIIATNFPLLVGWLLIVFGSHPYMLYCGRTLIGFAVGSFSVVVPIYVSEVADPAIRGNLGTLFQLNVVIGILLMYILGKYLFWNNLSLLCSIMPVIYIVIIYMLKDSPISYMNTGHPNLARKALIWFKNSPDIDEDMLQVQRTADEVRNSGERYKITNILCAKDVAVRKSMYLVVLLMLNQQLCGVNSIIFFTVDIFKSAGSTINANNATILVGIIQVLATITSSFVVNKAGRRPTLLLTQGIMVASLIALGWFFYFTSVPNGARSEVTETFGMVPILATMIYIIAFGFGLGPMAWLLMGELLSPKAIGAAGGLAGMVSWGLAFLVTVSFNYLVLMLGIYGAFWLFAAFCAVGMLFISKCLPETKNKTLQEIQDGLKK